MPTQTNANPLTSSSHTQSQPNEFNHPINVSIAPEGLVALKDAVRYVPAINGRRPSASTLYRWCRRGVGGVRLEYVRIGRSMATNRAALGRFLTALARADCY